MDVGWCLGADSPRGESLELEEGSGGRQGAILSNVDMVLRGRLALWKKE